MEPLLFESVHGENFRFFMSLVELNRKNEIFKPG